MRNGIRIATLMPHGTSASRKVKPSYNGVDLVCVLVCGIDVNGKFHAYINAIDGTPSEVVQDLCIGTEFAVEELSVNLFDGQERDSGDLEEEPDGNNG